MLGTWRTSDAEKNHIHKIGKRKKKKKRKKRPHDGWDGLGKWHGFLCGKE